MGRGDEAGAVHEGDVRETPAQSLSTYRHMTPAAQAEIDRLDRTTSTLTWAMEFQRRKKWQWQLERQAAANASLRRLI